MKKFKFRLEKLLDAKVAKEKAIQNELAKAVGAQNIYRMKQTEYAAKVSSQKDAFHKKFTEGSVRFGELEMFHRFENTAELVIADSQRKIDSMEPAINEIRSRLSIASQERKTIEKLKERRYREWQYHAKCAEDKENDDMNQKIYVRRMVAQMMEDTGNDGRYVCDNDAH
ncbi:MAG: flagellar export protein FliJ [Spirochaetota bacterium]